MIHRCCGDVLHLYSGDNTARISARISSMLIVFAIFLSYFTLPFKQYFETAHDYFCAHFYITTFHTKLLNVQGSFRTFMYLLILNWKLFI